jgi:hypothetical protein
VRRTPETVQSRAARFADLDKGELDFDVVVLGRHG